MASSNNQQNISLIDALTAFFNGDAVLKVDIGLSAESAVKFAVVAIVTTVVCVLIVRALK